MYSYRLPCRLAQMWGQLLQSAAAQHTSVHSRHLSNIQSQREMKATRMYFQTPLQTLAARSAYQGQLQQLLIARHRCQGKGWGSLSGGFLLLDCPRLLLRCAAACWKRGRGASKGDPREPMVLRFSDLQGLHRTANLVSRLIRPPLLSAKPEQCLSP